MNNPLTKIQTLKCNFEFRRAYKRGKSYRHPALVSYSIKNRAGVCRIGISTSKKIGNAVQRNRAKRVINAAFQSLAPNVRKGVDLVFVARPQTLEIKSNELEKIMRKHLELLNVLK